MSLLIFAFRKQMIISQKANIELEIMNLNQKKMDLMQYASSISEGSVSLNSMMNVPSSMFNRMSIFSQYSSQYASQGAYQQLQYMSATTTDPNSRAQLQQPQVQQMVFQNLYKQQLEKFAQQEKDLLNIQEKKIDQQLTTKQTLAQQLDAELKQLDEQLPKAAESSAPKYTA